MIRPTIAALTLLVVPAFVFAQADNTVAPLTDTGSQSISEAPPFVASLLLLKADWFLAAKEIDAELRKALNGRDVTKEDLAALPASGPRVLFPVSAISIYGQQHYAQFLAWLKARQLVVSIEPFTNHKVEPPAGKPSGAVTGWYAPTLSKSYEFFGLPAPQAQNDLFFTRKTEFTWSVSDTKVERELNQYEKGLGQEEVQPVDRNSFDRCQFTFNRLEDGQVMIAPAFPDIIGDAEFRTASNSKGFEALIVVEIGRSTAKETAEPKLLLPDKVERIKAQRVRGFDGGTGMSMPQLGRAPAAAGPPSRYAISKNVMISWSEARDVAWGFSKSLGRWAKQELDPPATEASGILSNDNLAVWHTGSAYYGFSGETGRWDILRLPEGRTPPPVLEHDFARVHDGDDLYTFSGSTGRWSSPKGSAEATESKPEETQFKIFALRNAKAVEAQVLINQLFARDIHSAVADERSNSLIVRGPSEQLNIIFHILTRLDEDGGGSQTAPAGGMPGGLPKEGGGMFGTIFDPGSTAETVEELAKKYNDKEQQALALARQIRELQSAPGDIKRSFVEMAGTLRRVVGEAFAARQKLHHAEVGQLQQRIAGIQRNVATRDRFSDKIIEVRVNDLLNPELQWESTSRLPGGTSATNTSRPSTTSTGRPTVMTDIWWEPESEQIFTDLGFLVQKLTRNDAPDPRLVGAMKIVSIDPDAPAKELQVGDVIVALQTTGGSGKERGRRRRVELHVRRGNDHFPVIVELPPRRAASSFPGLPGEASPPSDFSAQRAYRDKLRQRWEQIEQLYHGGRMEFDVMMQAAKDLAEAELSAAATPEDRRAARQRSLELLKGVKSIVDAKFDHDLEPEHKKLAVDAEVLKAEAQLAAEASHGQASPPSITPRAPPTSISLPRSEAATLRSADDFRRKLQELESGLADVQSATTPRFGATEAEHERTRKSQLESYQRDLAFLREEYAAQTRLLELEVQVATVAVSLAQQQHRTSQDLFNDGRLKTPDTLIASERAVQEADLRLQRAKILLDLYRKADPKNAAMPPAAEPPSNSPQSSRSGASGLPALRLPGPVLLPTSPK